MMQNLRGLGLGVGQKPPSQQSEGFGYFSGLQREGFGYFSGLGDLGRFGVFPKLTGFGGLAAKDTVGVGAANRVGEIGTVGAVGNLSGEDQFYEFWLKVPYTLTAEVMQAIVAEANKLFIWFPFVLFLLLNDFYNQTSLRTTVSF